jgi:putative PIN family toxin of toxin-antitoxin system
MSKLLRVVFDTNILVSGFLWTGVTSKAVNMVIEGRVQLLALPAIVAELRTTLSRDKFSKRFEALGKTVDEYVRAFEQFAYLVEPALVPEGTVRDPKDIMILACAVGGEADCIVTGDKDLLVLKTYEGIPIWTIPEFLEQLSAREENTP